MAKAKKAKASKAKTKRKTAASSSPPREGREFKLRIEKVPEPLWGKNLRSEEIGLGKYRWDKLKKTILEENGPACSICGDTEKPHGHEVWEYIETAAGHCLAKLRKIEIICRRCHNVHHWGNTLRMHDQGQISAEAVEALVLHFQRVNDCSFAEFQLHVIATSSEECRRSRKKWEVDWGDFAPMVAQAVSLRKGLKR